MKSKKLRRLLSSTAVISVLGMVTPIAATAGGTHYGQTAPDPAMLDASSSPVGGFGRNGCLLRSRRSG